MLVSLPSCLAVESAVVCHAVIDQEHFFSHVQRAPSGDKYMHATRCMDYVSISASSASNSNPTSRRTTGARSSMSVRSSSAEMVRSIACEEAVSKLHACKTHSYSQ